MSSLTFLHWIEIANTTKRGETSKSTFSYGTQTFTFVTHALLLIHSQLTCNATLEF